MCCMIVILQQYCHNTKKSIYIVQIAMIYPYKDKEQEHC